MDTNQLLEKVSPFIKKNILSLLLSVFGLIFFSSGLIALFGEDRLGNKEIVFEPAKDSLENQSQIKVDVAGEVINPGVYSLSFDSRIQDALVVAGGLSENADREWVSKNLNLAQKLVDGAKIYIPRVGENVKGNTLLRQGFGGQAGITGSIENGKINVNTASIEALDTLPGVGPLTAQKIIDGRPYSSIDDLLSKKVVGQKVFGEIKEKISVY